METTIITLPKFEDPRGNLSFVEEENHIPFKIERTYWIYDVPGGQVRGGPDFDSKCGFSQKNINNINESVREFSKV